MNFGNLIFWSVGVVTALSGIQNIDSIQRGILKAQSKVVYESRTETWGSPKFFREGRRSRSHSNCPYSEK